MHVSTSCEPKLNFIEVSKNKEYFADYGNPCVLRSDNGNKYTNKKFTKLRTNNKTNKEYTVPETPEQNGVPERYKRTVIGTTRSLLIKPQLPKPYGIRVLDTAAFVRNLVKDKSQRTPFEKCCTKKTQTEPLNVFAV